MSKSPFISVVMPVYNAQIYLDESVSSILRQTFSDLELILVNDCSKDESGRLCDEWKEKDSRVKVLHLKENSGAGQARNKGIEFATGEYLTFVDADDTIAPDLYSEVVDSLDELNADMVVWGLTEEYFDASGKLEFSNCLKMDTACYSELSQLRSKVIELEKKTLFGYQWNHLYRMDIIKKHNIRFEEAVLYEDYFFNVAVIKQIKTMNILGNCGYYYKKRMNDSITTRFVPEYFELSTRRVEEMYALHENWGMCTAQIRNTLANIYFRYILSALTRNCDAKSGITFKENKKWVLNVVESELYIKICKGATVNHSVLKVLQKLMDVQCFWGCYIAGKCVYIIKQKKPLSFSKIKKIRGENE